MNYSVRFIQVRHIDFFFICIFVIIIYIEYLSIFCMLDTNYNNITILDTFCLDNADVLTNTVSRFPVVPRA